MDTLKQDFIDALTHIQTICKIYDMSSMKVERIDIYTKQLLDKLKKGDTNNDKTSKRQIRSSKTKSSSKSDAKNVQSKRKTNKI